MKDRQAALSSFSASLAARGIRSIGRFSVVLLVARLYPIDDLGRFVFVLGLGTLAVGLLDFGVTNLIQRELGASGFEANALERSALRLRVLTLPVAVATSWVMGAWIDGDTGIASIGTLLFAAALGLSDFLAGLRRAKGDYVRESLELAPVLAGGLLSALAVGLLGGDIDGFQWALGAGALTPAVIRAYSCGRGLNPQQVRLHGPVRLSGLIWDARWFWVITLCLLGLFELPVVLIRTLSTLEEVGLYAAAMRAVGLVSQPFVVLGGVFLPSLAYQARSDRTSFLQSTQRVNRILLLALPAGLAVGIFGGTILLRSFGAEYLASVTNLWILTAGVLILVGPVYAGPLLIVRRERSLAVLAVLATGVLVAASVLIVPTYGSAGAAAAAALAFATAKAGHFVLYMRTRLLRLTLTDIVTLAGISAWVLALGLLHEKARYLALGLGGVVSVVASARLLDRTFLFGTVTEPVFPAGRGVADD